MPRDHAPVSPPVQWNRTWLPILTYIEGNHNETLMINHSDNISRNALLQIPVPE